MVPHAATLLLTCVLAFPAAAQYRVVVQEVQTGSYRNLDLTPDARYAWIVTGVNNHVLQVIETAGPRVVRRYFLPDRIESAWVDSDSRSLAVSTGKAIFLGSLDDDELKEALPGAHGAVRLRAGGGLLAVLGSIPNPKKESRSRIGFFDARDLGLYDLKAKRWAHIRPTPIVIPSVGEKDAEDLRPPALLFEGDALLASGIGGSVGSMIPITFQADVRLDLASGKTRITTGPSSRFGKIIPDKKEEGPGSPPPLKLPPEFKDIEFKNDPAYRFPEPLIKARNDLKALHAKVAADKILEKLSLGDRTDIRSGPMPFVVHPDRAQLALRRFLPTPEGFRSHTAILELTRDGKIEISPTRDTFDHPLAAGNKLFLRVMYDHIKVHDLFTGKALVPEPVLKTKGHKDLFFLPEGTLVRDATRLGLYLPDQEKPLWSRDRTEHKWDQVQVDARRETLALICNSSPILARLLNLKDGSLIADVPRPADTKDNFVPLALSADGKLLGNIHEKELRVFDAEEGKIFERHPLVGEPYLRDLLAWSGGWVLSDSHNSHVFDDRTKKWGQAFPFARAITLEEIETPRGKRLLLQSYDGQCCLVDPSKGNIESRWVSAEYGQYLPPPWNAVFAGGKALVRSCGFGPVLEVVDLRGPRLAATLHPVPVDKGLGWIAFTPDGWWDASPGAEQHVAVFHKGTLVEGKDREARFRPALVRERLAALWK